MIRNFSLAFVLAAMALIAASPAAAQCRGGSGGGGGRSGGGGGGGPGLYSSGLPYSIPGAYNPAMIAAFQQQYLQNLAIKQQRDAEKKQQRLATNRARREVEVARREQRRTAVLAANLANQSPASSR